MNPLHYLPNRRLTIAALALLACISGLTPASSKASSAPLAPSSALTREAGASARQAVELTFLKSNPGDRHRLKRFIEANWLEMDRIAKAQGLMSDYQLLDSNSDDGSWNLLMVVTYPDERGYAGIAEAFEKIRRAHTVVLIDGKGLRDLGAIVESRKLYLDAQSRSAP